MIGAELLSLADADGRLADLPAGVDLGGLPCALGRVVH